MFIDHDHHLFFLSPFMGRQKHIGLLKELTKFLRPVL